MPADIAHAVTVTGQGTGSLGLKIENKTVSGPQKAFQSVLVQLLSSDGPLSRTRAPLITTLRQNNLRDKSRLSGVFRNFVLSIIDNIDDETRPDDERVLDINLDSVTSTQPDQISLRVIVELRSGESTAFVMPVEL